MLKTIDLKKHFPKGGTSVRALDGINLEVKKGEWITLIGNSGSGKSTFLYTIAGLVKPTSGAVIFESTDLFKLSGAKRARFRGKNIGIIFQSFHLFPNLSALKNLLVSGGAFQRGKEAEAEALLERVGLKDRMNHLPSELSVGEKQRVAVARAAFCRPAIILADEPTGNLDAGNGEIVLNYLREFNKTGITVIFVTHKPRTEFEPFTSRVIRIDKGKLVEP